MVFVLPPHPSSRTDELRSGALQRWRRAGLVGALTVAVLLIAPGGLRAQGLHLETLANGTHMILVAQPLAGATSAAWPVAEADGDTIASLTSGGLTLSADLSAHLATPEGAPEAPPAPPFVVLVSAEPAAEMSSLLERLLAERSPAALASPAPAVVIEGGVERRLGRPGGDATLRLELPLPAMADPRRASTEVLFELLGELTGSDLPGLITRIEGDAVLLVANCDPSLAEMSLSRLRLSLDRLSADPDLESEMVERARRRVEVRRLALLEHHPRGARTLAEVYRDGGAEALRQYLFAVAGVTLEGVRAAAREWLPQHPGRAVLVLPPQVFNPRFAPVPALERLDNELTVAVLERPGTNLASLSLRPVLVPDLDGDLTATVLARLASALRQQPDAPGWIEVGTRPPSLDLAAPADSFAELTEALQRALDTVAADATAVTAEGGDARRRALRLLALRLGLDDGQDLVPAMLLQPGNLALGAVATDAEVASEALRKFGVGGSVLQRPPRVESLVSAERTREAAPGSTSVVALSLEMAATVDAPARAVVRGLVAHRLASALPARQVELVEPLVPGRRTLVAVVRGEAELPALEAEIRRQWRQVVAATDDVELSHWRRTAAAELARRQSGALGQARVCAAVAAGTDAWATSRELEMRALAVETALVDEILAAWASFDELTVTGAGILPITPR